MNNQALQKYKDFVKDKFKEDAKGVLQIYEDLYERDAPYLDLDAPETDESFLERCIEVDFDDGYNALAFPDAFVDEDEFDQLYNRSHSSKMSL